MPSLATTVAAIAFAVVRCSAVTIKPRLGDCSIPTGGKTDCGTVGTTNQTCAAAGCCWLPVNPNPNNEPWCFKKSGPPPGPAPPAPPIVPFNDDDLVTMNKYFMANVDIDDQGGVVASPDPNTPGGSYYFHWARDGALTMYTVLTCSPSSVDVTAKMDRYVSWVGRTHSASDSLVDSRVEAKFLLPDATPYSGPWCRPQTDGPGLRAITLISYANLLLDDGKEDHVRKTLWTGDSYSAIKYDLDWIADGGFNNATCDLWEEVRSNDFFWNKFTMRKALTLGAAFATKMNDPASASRYTNVANQLVDQIKGHYQNDFIFEEANRQKDGAVICALNDGYNDDGVFSASSQEVASTINIYNQAFHSEYPINSADDNNKIPGILYGRYPGDTYAGGNPWVLTSGCLAQLYFRAAAEVQAMGRLPAELEAAWRTTLSRTEKGNPVSAVKFESAADLAAALVDEGDGVLTRIRYHTVGKELHQPEQLDKNTGVEISATDLTWSYATIFKAMKAKKDYLAML